MPDGGRSLSSQEETVDDGAHIVDNPRVIKVNFSGARAPGCQLQPTSVARSFGGARCPIVSCGLLRYRSVYATYSLETYRRWGCFCSQRFKERSTTPGRRKLNTH